MRKKRDKINIKDVIFAVGVVMVIVIVGVGLVNASRAQEILGKTIRIISGDTEIVIEGKEDVFGGLVHNVQEDFSEGISVDGTEIINGSGEWVGDISVTATISNQQGVQPQWGDSDTCGCIIMGDSDHAGLSYNTVLNGTLTTTGGASTAFTIPDCCQ